MKKFQLVTLLAMLGIASASYAQSSGREISSTTDPAKAAAVEQRAEELRMQQQKGEMSSGSSADSGASNMPSADSDTHGKPGKAMKKHKARSAKPKTESGAAEGSTPAARGSSGSEGSSGMGASSESESTMPRPESGGYGSTPGSGSR